MGKVPTLFDLSSLFLVSISPLHRLYIKTYRGKTYLKRVSAQKNQSKGLLFVCFVCFWTLNFHGFASFIYICFTEFGVIKIKDFCGG